MAKDKKKPEPYYEPWVIKKYWENRAKLGLLEDKDGNKDNSTSR